MQRTMHSGPFPSTSAPPQILSGFPKWQPLTRGARHTAAAASNGSLPEPASPYFTRGLEGPQRQQLFDRIAPVYDQMNDLLSLGQHRVWKRMAVKWSGAAPGHRVLDVCCGSGDLTFRAAEAAGPSGEAVGLDFAAEMLDDAAQRETAHRHKRKSAQISWVQGDAMKLPFEDSSFDAATMGYGLRNVTDKLRALAELHRVLRPGRRVAILDFNNAKAKPAVDAFQGWCLDNVVVPVARWKGVGPEYEYLRPSIQQFPTGQEQEALAVDAGFSKAVHYEIGFGLMGVLVAQV